MRHKAIFKMNGGAGAILCSKCRVIIKTGKDFTNEELQAFRGEIELEEQICSGCKSKEKNRLIQ
jgi:hypothetical protein